MVMDREDSGEEDKGHGYLEEGVRETFGFDCAFDPEKDGNPTCDDDEPREEYGDSE